MPKGKKERRTRAVAEAARANPVLDYGAAMKFVLERGDFWAYMIYNKKSGILEIGCEGGKAANFRLDIDKVDVIVHLTKRALRDKETTLRFSPENVILALRCDLIEQIDIMMGMVVIICKDKHLEDAHAMVDSKHLRPFVDCLVEAGIKVRHDLV